MDRNEAAPISERMIARKEGAVGWIVFNNPGRRNAVSLDMWRSIPVILDDYEADPAVRVIVLRGAGEKAFVSGADISEFETARASADAVAQYDAVSGAAMERLEKARKPTIAMIHGFCIGGGVAVALACDLRIAAETARFGVPAAKLGLGYRANGIKKLLDIVGPAFVKEIFFTARQFGAPEALRIGLVNQTVPEAELEGFVKGYAETIAGNAPLTVASVKTIVAELLHAGDSYDRAKCERLVEECFASADYVEGRRAFMEKRKPAFTGR
jgi:enoyl-CoA hydratase